MNPDNPPAFPHNEQNDDGSHHYTHPGMTLRDWFAGQALAGRMINGFASGADIHARVSYELADAMLAERQRNPL